MSSLRLLSFAALACASFASSFAIAALAPDRLVDLGYLVSLTKTRADERLPEGWTKSFDDMFDIRGLADTDGKPLLHTKGVAMYADKLVGDDLYAMALAYRDANGAILRVTSSYRSVEEQAYLYSMYSARGDEKFSTPAGTSEHHLGTTFDFGLGENDVRYAWLAKHAPEYGFVMSYPAACRERTGVTEERWHYRWIGRELAAEYVARRDASDTAYCTVDFYADKRRELEESRKLEAARAAALKAQEEASRAAISQSASVPSAPVPVRSVLYRTGCFLIIGMDALSGSGLVPDTCR
jgi:hypothetical protein